MVKPKSQARRDIPLLLAIFLVILKCVHCSTVPVSSPPQNGSFLWRINSDPPAYLFGTIHVPYTRVWDVIPDNAKRAFVSARQIYFELDLTDHKTITSLSSCQLLPKGQHLYQVIPTSIYLRLKLHLEYVRQAMPEWITPAQRAKGIDAEYLFSAITANWERKQPVWVMMMVNSLNRNEVASRGVPVLDLYLSELAGRQKKKIHAIEKVEEQCQPLNKLGTERVIFALNQTLTLQDNLRLGLDASSSSMSTTEDVIEEYRGGVLNSYFFNQDTFQIPVLTSTNKDSSNRERALSREIDDYFREHLIEIRNERMAARVIDLLVNKPDTYFFAFGVGHFLGEKSVVEIIRSAGFTVDHIAPDQVLNLRLSSKRRNTVQGTFDDLPEDEKARALLQFLQYRQQFEKEDTATRQRTEQRTVNCGARQPFSMAILLLPVIGVLVRPLLLVS